MARSEESKKQQRERDLIRGPKRSRERYRAFKLKCHTYLGGLIPTCVDCSTTENLEISHNDASMKTFDILSESGYIYEKYWESHVRPELDKCSLRCEKCHLLYDNKRPEPVHGTESMYNNHGCRCDPCKKAAIEAVRIRGGHKERVEPQHGTLTMYSNPYRCRCDLCKEARTQYARDKLGHKPLQPTKHGTICMYNKHGCRCDLCKARMAEHNRSKYLKKKGSKR